MSTPADWLRIQQSMAAIREMNAVSVVLRRGSTTLAAQTMRVERKGNQSAQRASAGAEQADTQVVILGSPTLNIQEQDRFTHNGGLYEVTLVHPNRLAGTQVDAKMIGGVSYIVSSPPELNFSVATNSQYLALGV